MADQVVQRLQEPGQTAGIGPTRKYPQPQVIQKEQVEPPVLEEEGDSKEAKPQTQESLQNDSSTSETSSPDISLKTAPPILQRQEESVEEEEPETAAPEPEVQLQAAVSPPTEDPESPPEIQSKAERTFGLPQPGLETRLNASKGQGTPLPDTTQTEMEGAFGTDFSEVRIHTDSSAVEMSQELGAQAFTHGNDIYFNEGKFNPHHQEGQKLLAHELTHTVQQGANVQRKPDIQKEEVDLLDLIEQIKESNRDQRQAYDPSEARETRKEAVEEGAEAERMASTEVPEVVAVPPQELPVETKEGGARVAEPTPQKPDKVVPSSKKTQEPSAPAESAAPEETVAPKTETSSPDTGAETGGEGAATPSAKEGSSPTPTKEGAATESEGGETLQYLEEESAGVCDEGAEKSQELADNESAHDTAEEKAAQTDVQ